MAGQMSSFLSRASMLRRPSKHQSADSPPPTLPLAILTSNVDGDDDAPSLYELKEKSWSSFFGETHPDSLRSGPDERRPADNKHYNRGEVMRMPGVEMCQYGVLPETDPFMVVVCDLCKAAVKPQGLRKHIHRHSTADPNALASLITPCTVSVNALKFDPKADNSNSSTSSVYNMAGGSYEASSSSSSNHGVADGATPQVFQVQEFMRGTSEAPAPAATTMAGSSNSSAGASSSLASSSSNSMMSVKPKGGKPGSLKIKLSKTGLKTHVTSSGIQSSSNSSNSSSSSSTSSSSSSSRSVSASPNFLASDQKSSSLRPPNVATACLSTGVNSSTAASPSKGSLAPSESSLAAALESNSTANPLPPPTASAGDPRRADPSSGKKMGIKEREYDANKHCGVILLDTGKHCTRTLTCKSHALSLRRQVKGRSMSFDKLLSDHRQMRALATGKPVASSHHHHHSHSSSHHHGNHHHHHHHSHSHHTSSTERESGSGRSSGSLRLKREHSQIENFNENNHDRLGPKAERPVEQPPPAKKLQLDRHVSQSKGAATPTEMVSDWNGGVLIKAEPMDVEEPFRVVGGGHQQPQQQLITTGAVVQQQQPFEIKPFHENGFEVHGGPQLVAASNGGYFIKSEPQLDELDGEKLLSGAEAVPAAVPATVTVPLTMLGNVVYMNGRNCILQASPAALAGDEDDEADSGLCEIPGVKGRHVETVDGSGATRRYLTLSSNRQQRATNRLRLNVLKVLKSEENCPAGGGAQPGLLEGGASVADEFPGIDTWYSQIPKPTYVNCFKLCKLGTSGAVLSKRYLNIRKSLIMNMASAQARGGSPSVAGAAASVVSQFALNRSNSQSGHSPSGGGRGLNTSGGGGGGGGSTPTSSGGGGGGSNAATGYGVDKVNFSVERIKV